MSSVHPIQLDNVVPGQHETTEARSHKASPRKWAERRQRPGLDKPRVKTSAEELARREKGKQLLQRALGAQAYKAKPWMILPTSNVRIIMDRITLVAGEILKNRYSHHIFSKTRRLFQEDAISTCKSNQAQARAHKTGLGLKRQFGHSHTICRTNLFFHTRSGAYAMLVEPFLAGFDVRPANTVIVVISTLVDIFLIVHMFASFVTGYW
jgi:hypothetical protein